MKAIFILPALFLLAGCSDPDEGLEPAAPPPVAFEGKPDARFVGTWKVKGRDSTYILKKDGSYSFKGKVSTPSGVIDNSFEATWLTNGDKLLLKDASGNVTPYLFNLEGSSLKLTTTGSLKHETVMVRG